MDVQHAGRPVVVGVDGSEPSLLGSVSNAVLHRAGCPVVVVRGPGGELP